MTNHKNAWLWQRHSWLLLGLPDVECGSTNKYMSSSNVTGKMEISKEKHRTMRKFLFFVYISSISFIFVRIPSETINKNKSHDFFIFVATVCIWTMVTLKRNCQRTVKSTNDLVLYCNSDSQSKKNKLQNPQSSATKIKCF